MNTSSRFTRVRQIFDEALNGAPADRAATVLRLAGSEEDLVSEVVSLLEIHDRDVAGLENGPAAFISDGGDSFDDDLIGARIGPYRIRGRIGRGGMGDVYEAWRDDAEFESQVAIKVIRSGFGTESMSRRFRHERQILAALSHPNIARLLDGGVTPDGRPYLVMELVRGIPVNEYCDVHRLNLRERIKLFLSVCDAVEHAHTNLVVHRDLKPANILVTTEGVPKLLDFGIAKLLTPDIPETSTAMMTAPGMRFFTLEYASPEQIRGESVSTRSDVYSLGAVLYQLLSGEQPYRCDTRTPLSTERMLAAELSRPSTLVSDTSAQSRSEPDARRLRRRLVGDLDNIVLMALRKEAVRRYTSIEQFADDLRRYLAGRPIIATRDTAAYRFTRFVSRHRAAVLAGVFAAVSLLGGAGAAFWQAHAARKAAHQAVVESARARQVTRFITSIFGSADPGWISGADRVGPSTTVLAAIQSSARHIGRDLAGQPEVEATIRRTIGNTYQSLGLFDSARVQLDSAVALRNRSGSGPSSDRALDLDAMGALRFHLGRFFEAESLFRNELTNLQAIGDDSSVAFANAENNLAATLTSQGKLPEAEALQMRSIELLRHRLGAINPGVANEFSNLASLRARRGDLAGAEQSAREALDVFVRLHDRIYPEEAAALINLGAVAKWQGKYETADSALRRAEEILASNGLTRPAGGYAILQLAHTHYLMGKSIVADSEIKVAKRTLLAGGLATDHVEYRRAVTIEGQILTSLGKAQEAETLLRGTFPHGQVPPPPHDPRVAETICALGRALAMQGKTGVAGPLLAQSYADMLRSFGPRDARSEWARRQNSAFLAQLATGRIAALPR